MLPNNFTTHLKYKKNSQYELFIMDVKKFLKDTKHHWGPALSLTKRCLESFLDMRKDPNWLDYVNLALSFKDNVETVYNFRDPYVYFNNPKWKLINSDSLGKLICSIVQNDPSTRTKLIAGVDSVAAFIGEVEDVKFGWVLYDNEVDKLYVEKSSDVTYTEVLEKILWKQHKSNHIVIGVNESQSESNIYIKDDDKTSNFTATELARVYANEIQEYLNHGYSRSILYYGPPGSGKSNLVRGICHYLKAKTFRINNINKLTTDSVNDIIKIFNPDAVILEDLDNMSIEDVQELLDKIEDVNKKHKLLFATANQPSKFDNATIRPERFNQVMKISHLEREIAMELVQNDEEIYEKVQDWPAVSIIELMKRVKVKGKEYALNNMQDLIDRIVQINSTNYELTNNNEEIEEDEEEIEEVEKPELLDEDRGKKSLRFRFPRLNKYKKP